MELRQYQEQSLEALKSYLRLAEEQIRYTVQAMVEELERIGSDRPALVATAHEQL